MSNGAIFAAALQPLVGALLGGGSGGGASSGSIVSQALFGSLSGGIPGLSLIPGFGSEGAGKLRREDSRQIVLGSPPLNRIREAVLAGAPIRQLLASLPARDPEAAQAILAFLQLTLRQLAETFGAPPSGVSWSQLLFTSDKPHIRSLRDVWKYTTTAELVDPKRYLPTLEEAAQLLAGVAGPVAPTAPLYTALPVPAQPAPKFPIATRGGVMPYNYLNSVPTPSLGGGISATSIAGDLGRILLGGIQGALGQALPGGAVPSFGTPTAFGFDVTPGFAVAPQGGSALFEPYRMTGGGYRPQNFYAPDPGTGAMKLFGPLGKVLLTSRDLQAVRRVRKLAGRARRVAGGR